MAEPREKAISFSGAMVRAIERKSVTRRLIRNPARLDGLMLAGEEPEWAPYRPGDRLYVKEALRRSREYPGFGYGVKYDADRVVTAYSEGCPQGYCGRALWPWRVTYLPSRFMPRWAARHFLEVLSVRAERLQEITEEDAVLEGIEREYLPADSDNFHPPGSYGFVSGLHPFPEGRIHASAREAFIELWNAINGKRSPWERNDWVWRYELKRLETSRG